MRVIRQCRKCHSVEDTADCEPGPRSVEILGRDYGLCGACAVLPAKELVTWAEGEPARETARGMASIVPAPPKEKK